MYHICAYKTYLYVYTFIVYIYITWRIHIHMKQYVHIYICITTYIYICKSVLILNTSFRFIELARPLCQRIALLLWLLLFVLFCLRHIHWCACETFSMVNTRHCQFPNYKSASTISLKLIWRRPLVSKLAAHQHTTSTKASM